MKKTYLIFLFILNLQISFGQSIEATKIELNFQEDSHPQNLIASQSGFYFTATDGYFDNFGRELWFSDGTLDGTYKIKDINQGSNSSSPNSFTILNNILFFTANDGIHGTELWKSNGTEEGTVLVKDIRSNNSSTYNPPRNLVAFNNKVYFNATDGVNGYELWVSDGTEEGTNLVKDINTNGNSSPFNLFVFNNFLYFSADDGTHGKELWKSDGTEAGTILVKDINNNGNGSLNGNFIVSNDFFFFYATSDNYYTGTTFYGYELWRSDGTETGTVMVKDIRDGTASSNTEFKGIELNGNLFFAANDGINGAELWKSDGTEAGTTLVKNIDKSNLNGLSYNNIFKKLNNKIYFLGNDNIHGTEIWTSDGTEDGTKLVKDINEGEASVWIEKIHVDESNDKILFYTTSTNSNQRILWVSDGTENGTIQIPNVETPNTSSTQEYFCTFNDKTFFSGKNQKNGNELFVTDGTLQGTNFFKDLNYSTSSAPSKLTDVNGKVFFRGSNEQEFGNQLFSSDGTINGTIMVKRIGENSNIDDLSETVVINNKLFFSAHDNSNGYEPWISDGTEEGTFMIKDIRSDGSSLRNHNNKQYFYASDNKVYFSANDGVHGFEPWVSNGLEEGTFMLKDINTVGNGTGHNAEGGSSNSMYFTELNGYIYFNANIPSNSSLWKTDGTQSGTEIIFTPYSGIGYINKINNKLLINNSSGGYWISDGTTNGTTLSDLPSYLNINTNITLNNELFFISRLKDISNRYGLYKTDGTANGTKLLYEGLNHPTISTVSIENLIKCGKYIYFTITDYWYTNVPELWRTDGNITEKLDIDSSLNSSLFECHKNNLFYTTDNNEIKYLNDNLNEPKSLNIVITNNDSLSEYSYKYNLTSSGDNLYFSGYTDLSGEELFVMTPNLSVLNLHTFQNTDKLNKINIYPNPSNSFINIKSGKWFNKLNIYDIRGNLIIKKHIENTLETKLNVNNLTKGIYFLEIISDNKKLTQKLIIE
ncbi:ELWxxDGT repeat protein [Polaribacter sp. Asnod6-C07]|uniref:ELWxxDGT repeat protein n=1 Tax=Polaribacter sp. Asnod6-C07 TaxID=3160582 RepID=UPI00386AF380